MGERQDTLFPFQFNASVGVEGRPERMTGDGGALLVRALWQKLELDGVLDGLNDPRDPVRITHPLRELVRTEVFLRGQGWRDADDADALRQDPALRLAVSDRAGTSPLRAVAGQPAGLASQPTLSRMYGTLATEANRRVLREGLVASVARRLRGQRDGRRLRYATVDMDSFPIEVHGTQKDSAYNGHFGARVYHPLAAFLGETGDLLDVALRKGNAHTADGAQDFLLPLLEKIEKEICQVACVRMDAGYPSDGLLAPLETRKTPYVARIKNNSRLDAIAEPFLHRPVGRPPAEPRTWLHELTYKAESWSKPRRVVLVVQERPDELFLHHFFLLTSYTLEQKAGEKLLELYRQRGTAEGHIGELMSVLDPALSSALRPKSHYRGEEVPVTRTLTSDPFAVNEVRLLINALAYNLVNGLRILAEDATKRGMGLQRFRDLFLKVPARMLLHARRVVIVIGRHFADRWGDLTRRIAGLQAPA